MVQEPLLCSTTITTGIDVDKWDYFLRDDYYCKIGHVFDYKRFITFCQVKSIKLEPPEREEGGGDAEPKSRRRICIRDKEVENLWVQLYSNNNNSNNNNNPTGL